MSLKDINKIDFNYNTLEDDLPIDFLVPCLEEAIEYKRAVAFFTSEGLLDMTRGLWSLAKRGGNMKLLVSPKLEQNDCKAIEEGYDLREKITSQLIDNFNFDIDYDQKDARFKLLSYMIASGTLDIKIVLIADDPIRSLFHRKTGIFTDEDGNRIAFSGSGNESEGGHESNDEEWDVYCSWEPGEEKRCDKKEDSFDLIWDEVNPKYITIPFPDVIKNKILNTYKADNLDTEAFAKIDSNYLSKYSEKKNLENNGPRISSDIHFFDHQKEAVKNWVDNGYCGIFDMATGTGKTYAAGGCICQLFNDKKRCIVVVCCPQKTLVEQWGEELKKFNINAIKCYSEVDYEKELNREIADFEHKFTNFVCIVITNRSFQKESIQKLLIRNRQNVFLIVDEAHNFGGDKIITTLQVDYSYRLALSATFERYGDPEGTAILYDYFKKVCLSYDTEKALQDGVLCKYYYYPICVSLSAEEYDEYVDLSRKYAKKASFSNSENKVEGSDTSDDSRTNKSKDKIDPLLLKRARLIAGAKNKITKLEETIEPYKNSSNMLVYCGDPYLSNDEVEMVDKESIRQIDAVASMLNRKMGITTMMFTSAEDSESRSQIINAFKKKDIQAIVAIKCLDEGVDIPAIETAFILASTTNPRQYIQRRGRVLRKSPGKDYAKIYDFVVLPRPLGSFGYKDNPNSDIEKSLVRKEITRMREFALLSENSMEYYQLINQINEEYNLDVISKEENEYGDK